MKIAIVNDMVIAVEALRQILKAVPEYELAWIAWNGSEAVTKCAQNTPDLILMDLIMPVMDGVEATRQIMANTPCAIVIVTACMDTNSAKVFQAMGWGALDVVPIPVLPGHPDSAQPLLDKIRTISKLIGKSKKVTYPSLVTSSSLSGPKFGQLPLIVIGSSTGGPHALVQILSRLPHNFSGSIIIIQHLDVRFSADLVEWLNRQTPLNVMVATRGCRPEMGKVLVAGSNDHLAFQSNLTLTYIKEPIDYPYRPSVDVFFKSVAQYWQSPGVAVLLTGMGRDGAAGMAILREKGWKTIAQDEETSAVYGMPKAAIQLGAATEILPLSKIANQLEQFATINKLD